MLAVTIGLVGPSGQDAHLQLQRGRQPQHDELREAAEIDGTTPFMTFRRIGLPLSTQALASVLIIPLPVFFSLQPSYVRGLLAGSVNT